MSLNFKGLFSKKKVDPQGPSEIGYPTNVKKVFHVHKNKETGQLEGLPNSWIKLLNTQIT